MGGPKVKPIPVIDIDEIRDRILAECVGKDVHGCEFPENEGPEDYTLEEEQAFILKAQELHEQFLKENPDFRPDISAAEKRARMAFTMGKLRGSIPVDEEFSWNPKDWK